MVTGNTPEVKVYINRFTLMYIPLFIVTFSFRNSTPAPARDTSDKLSPDEQN